MYARSQDALRAESRDWGGSRYRVPPEGRYDTSKGRFVLVGQATLDPRPLDHYIHANTHNIGQAQNANFGVNNGHMVCNAYYNAAQPGDLLSKLNPILDASYTRNLKLSPPASVCFHGTRLWVIGYIKQWANNLNLQAVPHILWIFGYAGCGKSAIAQTIAEEFAQQGRLAACFFFFRGAGDRSGVSRFATTVASQMVAAFPATRPLVEAVVKSHPWLLSHSTASIGHQFEYLVYHPLRSISHTLRGPVLIVFDGVDECGDREDAARFIEHMTDFFRRFPDAPFRILISSRVENHIHELLHTSPTVQTLNLVEHTPDEDISVALDVEIDRRRGRRILACDKSWPSWWDKQELVKHIGGSFIFMTTVIKYLFDPDLKDGLTPMQRLPLVLDMKPNFDALYKSILEPCQHFPHFHNILSTIALAFKSVSISQIAGLLELTTSQVVNVLISLHAIMQVPGDDRTPITLWHTSVRDFVTSEDRAGPFFVSHTHHILIARGCIRRATDSNPSATREYSQRYALQHLRKFLTTHGEDAADQFDGTMAGLGRCLDQPVFIGTDRWDGTYEWPALQVACQDKDWKLVRALVIMGATINVRSAVEKSNVVTALHTACHHREFNMIYFLLENGANPNVSGLSNGPYAEFNDGTPLNFASYTGDIELVTRLLECGADPNFQGGVYGTALQAACIPGNLGVVSLLLEHGADLNLIGGHHSSALHACAYYGRVGCAQALLEHKADPNVRDKYGGTPLHGACYWGKTWVAELLLDFGADPIIRNNGGKTALQAAIEVKYRDNSDTVQMLQQHGVTK
ncbi:hypothetical protein NMY22_g18506 [Coprinellus aureogranulatus]|nr:hypothetical protein NMY22_g18506 [Coprinellus aureogranulatus]